MKIMTLLFGVIFFALPISAFAQTSWAFVKKNAGPDSWTCPQVVLAFEQADTFFLRDKKGPEVLNLDRLNKGSFCNRHQNGGIFGTLTCVSNLKNATEAEVGYENKTCSSDLPFSRSCTPKEIDRKVILSSSSLMFSIHTGWQDDPVFECIYKPLQSGLDNL